MRNKIKKEHGAVSSYADDVLAARVNGVNLTMKDLEDEVESIQNSLVYDIFSILSND